jgi:hypothetical protein
LEAPSFDYPIVLWKIDPFPGRESLPRPKMILCGNSVRVTNEDRVTRPFYNSRDHFTTLYSQVVKTKVLIVSNFGETLMIIFTDETVKGSSFQRI